MSFASVPSNRELAVVLGADPIGILVALVVRAAGGRVILSEVNAYRRNLAESLGLQTVNPVVADLPTLCQELSDGAGGDPALPVLQGLQVRQRVFQIHR